MKADKNTGSKSQKQLTTGLKSYRDENRRPYIHLVDGGIADNLGLRTISERFEVLNSAGFADTAGSIPDKILIVLVNAEVKPERYIDSTATKPSTGDTMSAYTSAQMDRYNQETLDGLRESMKEFETSAAQIGSPTKIYFTEIGFELATVNTVNRFFNNLPTSLQLEEAEVDRLVGAGRLLLRHEPTFKRFKEDSGASLVDGAISNEEICRLFGAAGCQQKF